MSPLVHAGLGWDLVLGVGEKLTTNNRIELMAAIKALEYCFEQEKEMSVLDGTC